MVSASASIKPVFWIGSAKANLSAFPEEVKDSIGFALYVAQQGGKHASVKPLRGFGGAGVLEVVEDHDGRYISSCIHGEIRWSRLRSA